MKTSFFLKVNHKGAVNVTKTAPYLSNNEVSVYITVELPDVLFKKPQISANIKVDEKNVQPFTIDADTLNNVKDAIELSTGMDITIKLENPEVLNHG